MMVKSKRNQGFTLVELMVTLGITVVLIGLTCSILVSTLDIFNRDSTAAGAKFIGDDVSEWFETQLRYATGLQIAADESEIDKNKFDTAAQIRDDNLFYWKTKDASNKRNYFTEEYYNGMTVSMTSKLVKTAEDEASSKGRYLNYTIYVYNANGDEAYRVENTVELINMGVAEKNAEGGISDYNIIVADSIPKYQDTENAVFGFSSDLMVNWGDYYPPPVDMYSQAKDIYFKIYKKSKDPVTGSEIVQFDKNACEEYLNSFYMNNEGVRDYVRKTYYNGVWPSISEYLDITAASEGVPYREDGYNPGSLKFLLDKYGIKMKLHISSIGSSTPSIVIFGQIGNMADDINNNWNNIYMLFVPDTIGNFTSGKWYTYLQVANHAKSKYPGEVSIAANPRLDEPFYETVRKYWHPVDGLNCICADGHSTP